MPDFSRVFYQSKFPAYKNWPIRKVRAQNVLFAASARLSSPTPAVADIRSALNHPRPSAPAPALAAAPPPPAPAPPDSLPPCSLLSGVSRSTREKCRTESRFSLTNILENALVTLSAAQCARSLVYLGVRNRRCPGDLDLSTLGSQARRVGKGRGEGGGEGGGGV